MKLAWRLLFAFLLTWSASSTALAEQTIQTFNPDSLRQIVASQKGQPFVLVVWSLDCVYCGTNLKTLSQQTKLKIVTVATDVLDDVQIAAQLQQRLKALGLA